MSTRDAIDLLLLGAIWGASFLFMRIASPEFGPVPLIAVRVGIAAIFISAVLAKQQGLRVLRPHAVPLFVLGAINVAVPFSLFAYAVLSITAGFAAILNATAPLFVAVVAYLWLGDRLSPRRIAGLTIGFIGVLILVWGRTGVRDDGSNWAVVAGLTASFCYGIGTNYTKQRLTGVDPLVVSTGTLIAATLLLLIPAVAYWPRATPSAPSWVSAGALAILCTGIAFVLFFRLISRLGPSKAMTVTYLIPAFGIVWGALFLGESISANMTAGFAVVLLGTALATGALSFGTFR